MEPSKKLSGCLDCSLQIVVAVCRLQFAVYLSQQKCWFYVLNCSTEWGIGIAFGTWYGFEFETQCGMKSDSESGTQYKIEWLPR